MSSLKGTPELRARLKAIKTVFKPVAKEWGDRVVILAKARIPQRTGKTRASVKRTNSTLRKTRVGAFYPVNFIDAGTKAHDVKPKRAKTLAFRIGGMPPFNAAGRPVFAKKVHIPAKAPRPFKHAVGVEALRETDMLGQLISLWNGATSARGGGANLR